MKAITGKFECGLNVRKYTVSMLNFLTRIIKL